MLSRITSRADFAFVLIAGGFFLAMLGRNRIYMAAQGESAFSKFLRRYIGHVDLEWLTRNWRHVREDGENPRLNAAAIAHYGTADLGGWALESQNRGDSYLPLEQQMRGLIIPLIEDAIREGKSRVVEIGSGDGKILKHLAQKFPDVEFTGVDFVKPEIEKTNLPNLRFVSGYALELFEKGEIQGQILFACMTFCLPGPREIEGYAKQIANAGFSTVLINDPVTRAYSPEKYPNTSRHQTFGMWGHDYRHYFGREGYRTSHFEVRQFLGHRDVKVTHRQLVRLDRV